MNNTSTKTNTKQVEVEELELQLEPLPEDRYDGGFHIVRGELSRSQPKERTASMRSAYQAFSFG